jgi:hypothetical protein
MEFHDWDDVRAELDDGDGEALAAERRRTEAWISAFRVAEERHQPRARHSASEPRSAPSVESLPWPG